MTEGEGSIFHRMVFVDPQIAVALYVHAESAVSGDLVKHMIEKANAGFDFVNSGFIQPYLHFNIGFFGFTHHFGKTWCAVADITYCFAQ